MVSLAGMIFCPLLLGNGMMICGCVFGGLVVTVGDGCVSLSIVVMVVVTLKWKAMETEVA